MKTSNVSEIYWFEKTRGWRMRECEGEGARVRQRGRNLAPSPESSILESRVVYNQYISDTFGVFFRKPRLFYFLI